MEYSADARFGNGCKEIGKVETKDHITVGVRCRKCQHRAAAAKTMGGIVNRYFVDDLVKNAALNQLETCFGRFEQAIGAGAFWYPRVMVVGQLEGACATLVTVLVG